MAAQFLDSNDPITELRNNYAAIREERGWSWEVLAESLSRQGADDLAMWALSNVVEPDLSSRGSASNATQTTVDNSPKSKS